MAIEIACPQCGTRNVRVSQARGFLEHVRQIFGVYPLRCKKCNARFRGAIWKPTLIRYARCPKCYRMELSTWSEQYYNPPARTLIMLRLGATPYRCEFCRCNFASFRACKERFLWRKYRKQPSGTEPADDAGPVNAS